MLSRLLKCLFAALVASSAGAVPLKWTVETSKAQVATFDQFQGATYDLEASLLSYGKPLYISGDPNFYWQTNGMGSLYWSIPATATNNIFRATWTPNMDVGAKVYNCFIGVSGTVYNAACVIRLRPSPGAVPNALPLPTPFIDCAVVKFVNPTNSPFVTIPKDDEVPFGHILRKGTNGVEWVQNKGVNTNVVEDLIANYDATNLTPRIDERILMPSNTVPVGRLLAKATNGVEWIFFQGGGGSLGSITMVRDTTNGWHNVRAELNPAGQIVLSIEQEVSTNSLLTIEEERDRAMFEELANRNLITNEVIRATESEEDLSDRINAISSVGRFLSTWDCTTGTPGTEPKESPMPYRAGDYYLVAAVSQGSITNFVPCGTVYTNGSVSTQFTTNTVSVNDLFRHTDDGSWVHVAMSGVTTTFALIAGSPRDNEKLAIELDKAATNILDMVICETNRAISSENLIRISISNEIVRAYMAETNLSQAVSNEAERAYCAETNLHALVEAETNRACVAETNLHALVEAETNRAYTEETNIVQLVWDEAESREIAFASLYDMITNETHRATVTESNITAVVAFETNRAQTAEASISSSVTAETVRATTVENRIASELIFETNRAHTVESALSSGISAETVRATTAESNLNASLVAETNRAQTAEASISSAVTAETSRATTAEANLNASLIAETNRAQNAEASISSAVTAETSRATTAEANLQSSITSEASRATAAEGAISASVSAETVRANTAENKLNASLIAETNRAQIAESAIYTTISNEISRATLSEATITASVATEKSRAEASESTLNTAIQTEASRAIAEENSIRALIGSETNRAIAVENALSAQIAAEEYRAGLAEAMIRASLSNETSRSQLEITNVNNRVTSEITRASSAEVEIQAALDAETARSTAEDANIKAKAFDTAQQKTNALNQIETSRLDIIALGEKDDEQDEEIGKLRRKSYWVGSIATIPEGSDIDEVLDSYVTNTMHRLAYEGDQVTVTDVHTVYQRAADTHWKVFTDAGAVEHASGTQYGVVKVGSGIDVTNGVISVTKDNSIRVFATLDFEAWVDSAANVPVESSVLVYADTTTGGGIAAAALYRIYKKDASTVVVDAYAIGNGKLYRKIKALGSWGSFAEIGGGGGGGGSAEWGSIGGNLTDQIDLNSVLVSKLNTSDVVQNLNDTNPQHAASIVSLANVGKRLVVVDTRSYLPATGSQDAFYICRNDRTCLIWLNSDNSYHELGGGGTWGSITGELRDQIDLHFALSGKMDKGDIKDPIASYYHVDAYGGASFLWYPDATGDYRYDTTNGCYAFSNNGKHYTITEINAQTSMLRCVYSGYDDRIYFDRTLKSPIVVSGSGFYGAIVYHKIPFSVEAISDSAGNRINANRDVTSAIDTFVGDGKTLSPSRSVANRWEVAVGSTTYYVSWNGTAWVCGGWVGYTVAIIEGSGLNATKLGLIKSGEAQIDLVRTASTRSDGKVVCSLDINRQIIFDMCHPVNSVWIQYTNDDNPNVLFSSANGISCTWTDVTASFQSRFFKADQYLSVGTLETESLPKPVIATAGAHTHAPGTLDVVSSWFGVARKNAIYDRVRAGAFTFTKGGDGTATYQDTDLDGKNSSYVYNINMKLAGNWNTSTATASGGGHSHSVNTSGPYGDNYSVKPLTYTIKVWKRTN